MGLAPAWAQRTVFPLFSLYHTSNLINHPLNQEVDRGPALIQSCGRTIEKKKITVAEIGKSFHWGKKHKMAVQCVKPLQCFTSHLPAIKWFTPYEAKVFFVFYIFPNASCLMGHQSKTHTYCKDSCSLHHSPSLCLSGFQLKHKLRFHDTYNYAKL